MEMKTFLRANWDRALAVALILAGVVMLVIGWFGVSGTGLVAEQNPYLISAGLGGVAAIAIGCTLWMSADLQDEWRRLDAIEERLERLAEALERPPAPSAPSRSRSTTNGAGRRVAKKAAPATVEAEDTTR